MSEPIAGNLDINMFSKIVDTVCDFPEPEQEIVKCKVRKEVACYMKESPWTPQIMAEKGEF